MVMPKCNRFVMIENNVVSWPPCWLAVEGNAPPTLPFNTPPIQSPPAWSRKLAICDAAPRLLAAFHPAAAATLYPAWANIATAPSTLNVYAARTKAGIFANNFAGAVGVTEPEKRDPNKGGNTTTTTTIFTPPLLGDAVRDLISSDGLSLIGLPLDATYEI